MWEYVLERREQIAFQAFQHASLVVQCVALATVLAVAAAVAVYRRPRMVALANGLSAIGLTIPSFALLGLLLAPFAFGVTPAVIAVTFYAALPILCNAIVGLSGVDRSLVESARGIGMSRLTPWRGSRSRWPGPSSSPVSGCPPRW
jgi:osmoprotectant transport system permease protein